MRPRLLTLTIPLLALTACTQTPQHTTTPPPVTAVSTTHPTAEEVPFRTHTPDTTTTTLSEQHPPLKGQLATTKKNTETEPTSKAPTAN